MAPSTPELKSLFLEALERPEGPERTAYLDVACRGDAALRAQVDELLEAHGRAGGFLSSAVESAAPAPHPAPTPPTDAAAAPAAPARRCRRRHRSIRPRARPGRIGCISPDRRGTRLPHRTLPTPAEARRGRHGRRLPRRARPAGPAAGGAEGHQAGDGHR